MLSLVAGAHAEPSTISRRAFNDLLFYKPEACFVVASPAYVPPETTPLVYCIWERYEAGTLRCRLSGYDLEKHEFTEQMPNGEAALEIGRSCAKGGIAGLMDMKVKDLTAREFMVAKTKFFFSGEDAYRAEIWGPKTPGTDIVGSGPPLFPGASGPVQPPMGAEEAPSKAPFTSVKVFFATDRHADGNEFNDDRSETDSLQFGAAEVSVPLDHQLGNLESPSIFRLEFAEDPKRHLMVRSVTKQNFSAFESELQDKIAQAPEKDAFVFIHGYNNTFRDSLRRAAQMTYDLNFQGAPIVYSWPSGNAVYKYSMAEANVDWTFRHLAKFLISLPRITGAKKIHLIAHSMGNRVLTNALMQLMDKNQTKLFNQIILAAPDIDAEVFGQIAEQVQHAGERVTIYASKNDEALNASQKFHSYTRLGQGGDKVFATSFSDTIDTSTLISGGMGHSYFGDDPTVLTDIGKLILEGLAPANRPPLIEEARAQVVYWKFGSVVAGVEPRARDIPKSAAKKPQGDFQDRFFFSPKPTSQIPGLY